MMIKLMIKKSDSQTKPNLIFFLKLKIIKMKKDPYIQSD